MRFITFSCIVLVFHVSIISGFSTPMQALSAAQFPLAKSITCPNPARFGNKFAASSRLRMIGSTITDVVESIPASAGEPESPFACPQCGAPTDLNEKLCSNCGAPFEIKDGYVDLTPESTKLSKSNSVQTESSPITEVLSGFKQNPFVTSFLASSGLQFAGAPIRQELFRTPLVSFLYERGWRQGFASAGFPGIEKEYDLVMDFFQGTKEQTVIDLSCGSGLMVRRLAKSRRFGRVIAVDYSESMLQEVLRRAAEEACPEFDVLRADVARMPFRDASVDAVHSGAALHCWPSVQDGLRQVHRVLRPGGKFFATTFLWGVPSDVVGLGINLSGPGRRNYRFFNVEELEWLMRSAGFAQVEVERRNRCAIIRCSK